MDMNQTHLPGSRNRPRTFTFSSWVLHTIERSLDEEDARILDGGAAPAAARREPMTNDDFEQMREDLLKFIRSIAAARPKPIPTEERKMMMAMKDEKMTTTSQQSGSGERMIVAASPLGYGCYVRNPIMSRSTEQQQHRHHHRATTMYEDQIHLLSGGGIDSFDCETPHLWTDK